MGWAAKNLSIAGRLQLLNAVLSSLPIYYMSVFRIPAWAVQEIDKIRRRFLWHGVVADSHKLNLANWSIVCMPRKLGGLGVLDLKTFNSAMLMKWCWQWVQPKDRLWKSIFTSTHWSEELLPDSTLFSKTLQHVYSFFDISVSRQPGNGNSIGFWIHDWGFGILKYKYPTLYTYSTDPSITLSGVMRTASLTLLFHANLSVMATEELRSLQTEIMHDVQLVHDQQDEVTWKWDATGTFSVRSAYYALMDGPRVKSNYKRIWKLLVPPRMKVFVWLMLLNRILTIDNLAKRGWCLVNWCVMCKSSSESVRHLFSECAMAFTLYRRVEMHLGIRIPGALCISNEDVSLATIDTRYTREERSILAIAQFTLWRERCCRIFRDSEKGISELVEQVQEQWKYSMLSSSA